MKKTYFLLLFVFVLQVIAKAQTDWITKKLDEKISVKFPIEPQKLTNNGNDTFVAKESDSLAYSAGMIDLKVVANLDSATLAPMKDSQEFANQMVKGIASKKKNYAFGDVTIGKWKNFTSYNTSAYDNTNKNTLLVKIIFIGSKMYLISCRVPADIATKKNNTFFSSIEILK